MSDVGKYLAMRAAAAPVPNTALAGFGGAASGVPQTNLMAVSINEPEPGDSITYGDTLTVLGTISRPGTVQLFLDGVLLGEAEVTGLLWSYDWLTDVGDVGEHSLTAVALPEDLSATTESVPVDFAVAPPIVPIVAVITAPLDGADYNEGDIISIEVTVNVAGTVEVFVNGVSIGDATMVGLVGTIDYEVEAAALGDLEIDAHAIATVGGSTADADTVTIEVVPIVLSGLQTVLTPWVWDNELATATGSAPNDYLLRDPQSRLIIQTQAGFDGSLTIKAVGGGGPPGSGVDIFVDGTYNQTTQHNSLGVSTTVIATIASGSHTVTIQEGQSHIQAIGANSFAIEYPTDPETYLIAVGDSITAAANASPEYLSWVSRVRADGGFGGVLNYGHSGYTMTTYQGGDSFATTLAALGARRKGTVKNVLWIAMGTNDYANTGLSAAAIGAQCVAMCSGYHALYPDDTIIFQTPIPRAVETAVAGRTCQQVRDGIMAALTGSCPYVVRDPGESIAGITLDDGLHPTAAGHGALAAHNLGVLGNMHGTAAASVTPPTFAGTGTIVGGFLPNQIAGNKLFLRGDLGVTLNATEVSAWADQSGVGNHATQGTSGNQPTFVAASAGLNNQAAVSFVRANSDYLIADGLGAMVSGTAKAYDIWEVISFPTLANTRASWSFGNSGVATPFLYGSVGSTKAIQCNKTVDGGGNVLLQDTTNLLSDDTKYIIRYSSNGTLLTIYVNGVATLVLNSTEAAGAITTNRFTIGGLRTNGAPNNLYNGSIAEILAYDSQLGATPAGQILTYLKTRYDIP